MCKYASKHARRFYDPIETCNQARPLRDTVQDATNGFGGGGVACVCGFIADARTKHIALYYAWRCRQADCRTYGWAGCNGVSFAV